MSKPFQWRFVLQVMNVAVFSGLLSACLSWWQPERMYENEISSTRGYYLIEPDTILESLASQKLDVFLQTSEAPEWTDSLGSKRVAWNQSDYFQIVRAFHEFVWQESIDEWKLHSMSFAMACEDSDRGYLYADYEYFKLENIGDQKIRIVRRIHLRPGNNSIDWWERQLSPLRENWPVIDLSKVRVTVDEALALAESNGGNTARLSVSNECNIYLLLKLDAFYEGWQVGYSRGGPKNIFKINIDPLSGEYEVVNP